MARAPLWRYNADLIKAIRRRSVWYLMDEVALTEALLHEMSTPKYLNAFARGKIRKENGLALIGPSFCPEQRPHEICLTLMAGPRNATMREVTAHTAQSSSQTVEQIEIYLIVRARAMENMFLNSFT